MNSLPLISHHLFVAAIDEPRNSQSLALEANHKKSIEVEVLDWTVPLPDPASRPTRAAPRSTRI
jgi:hypothetical protein